MLLSTFRRVVLVVLDGLRPDAIERFALPTLRHLGRTGAATLHGRTVCPSVTMAAMTSLVTGVDPRRHGVRAQRFGLPRDILHLDPVPRVLRRVGVPTTVLLPRLSPAHRWMAGGIARAAGVEAVHCGSDDALDTVAEVRARHTAGTRDGLLALYWPEADRAGHRHGWMSPEYGAAASRLDDALGALIERMRLLDDPDTLLVALADHGGGGERIDDHESDHPLDTTIPILLAGARVPAGELFNAHLLDVPATVLRALGTTPPPSYTGRILWEALAERGTARSPRRSAARPAGTGAA